MAAPRNTDDIPVDVDGRDAIEESELDPARCTEPLDDGEGGEYVICQDATGADTVEGGGEFPDPDTPPRPPAPGSR